MPTFSVYAIVKGSKYLGDFEAETKEEAEMMALDSAAANISLCYQCANQCEDPSIASVIVELSP